MLGQTATIFEPLNCVIWGTGKMGVACTRAALGRGYLKPVAAIVSDPARDGRDLGEICGLAQSLGAPASTDADSVLVRSDVDVVCLCGFALNGGAVVNAGVVEMRDGLRPPARTRSRTPGLESKASGTRSRSSYTTTCPISTRRWAGTGPAMVGRYFAAVYEIAGVPVTVPEIPSGVQAELGIDALEQSSVAVSEGMADATRDCIREARSRITADYGVVIESPAPTVFTFTGGSTP